MSYLGCSFEYIVESSQRGNVAVYKEVGDISFLLHIVGPFELQPKRAVAADSEQALGDADDEFVAAQGVWDFFHACPVPGSLVGV